MKALLLTLTQGCGLWAAVLLPGYTETQIASGLSRPTSMATAPDGRVFVTQQEGALRVISAAGALLSAPALTLQVDASGERGLIGMTLDPNFASNNFVYLHYTVPGAAGGPAHNRVSRFTMSGDTVLANSELAVQDLEDLTTANNHNGGALRFGPDGKLYIGVGENAAPSNSQTLANRLGKILRINPDGSVPSDNPFAGTTGASPQIWAIGLRNPYQMAFDSLTGRLFINDVGGSRFEEINQGAAGANYGWPSVEGSGGAPGFADPVYSYGRSDGCAITGGAFRGGTEYYFSDFCQGTIRVLNTTTLLASGFASGIPFGLVDLAFSSNGDLYYLYRGTGASSGALFLIDFPDAMAIPEPASAAMLLSGLFCLSRYRRNRKRTAPQPAP